MVNKNIMDEIADITMRWACRANCLFPRWELNELHNEAFLVALRLVDAGRYKPEKGKLSTFLWHALRMDVRHQYRRAFGERYLTYEDGKRKYQKKEICDSNLVNANEQSYDGTLQFVEPKMRNGVNATWLKARLSGDNARDLRKNLGMSYEQQRYHAETLREAYLNEQHRERQEG